MNNANYFRVAELHRWRGAHVLGNLKMFSDPKGCFFLVAQQSISYKRPILPFQRYIVTSKVTSFDDKWLHMEHTFVQHPLDVKPNSEPTQYAAINLKVVLKEKSGKTISPTVMFDASDIWNHILPE